MYELDKRLEKWVKFHHLTLMGATLHAIDLPKDINNARKTVLYIKLKACTRDLHGDVVGKYFRVEEAYPLSVEQAMKKPAPWPESLEQLTTLQDESEANRRGRVIAAMVECPPLSVQTVPFASIPRIQERKVQNWKELLVRAAENGHNFEQNRY